MSKDRIVRLDHPMPFGKFRGERVRYLLANEINYVQWLAANTDIEFEDIIYDALENEGLRQELIDDSNFV